MNYYCETCKVHIPKDDDYDNCEECDEKMIETGYGYTNYCKNCGENNIILGNWKPIIYTCNNCNFVKKKNCNIVTTKN